MKVSDTCKCWKRKKNSFWSVALLLMPLTVCVYICTCMYFLWWS